MSSTDTKKTKKKPVAEFKKVPSETLGAADAFVNHEPFESLEAIFGEAPKPVDFETAIFFLDANSLLAPYRQDAVVLHAIEKQFAALIKEGRLVVPFQATREFAKNRHAAIGKLVGRMSGAALDAVKPLPKLFENLTEYDEAAAAHTAAEKAVAAFNQALSEVIARIETWDQDDPIYATYRRLFSDKEIGHVVLAREDLKAAAKVRYAKRLPPGFGDDAKGDANKEGDLVIWRTILEVGAKRQRDAVFVTEEQKHDWFSRGRFPRPELADEYNRYTGGHNFTAMNLSEMMAILNASPSVVADLKPPHGEALERVAAEVEAKRGHLQRRQDEFSLAERLHRFAEAVTKATGVPTTLVGNHLKFTFPSLVLVVKCDYWTEGRWNLPEDGHAHICDAAYKDVVLASVAGKGSRALVISLGWVAGEVAMNTLESPELTFLSEGLMFKAGFD